MTEAKRPCYDRRLHRQQEGESMDFEIDSIAALARIELKPEEKNKLRKDIVAILEYVKKLEHVNTDEVMPTSHVLDIENVYRPDVLKPSGVMEEVLKHAPEREGNFFKVPKVVEKS